MLVTRLYLPLTRMHVQGSMYDKGSERQRVEAVHKAFLNPRPSPTMIGSLISEARSSEQMVPVLQMGQLKEESLIPENEALTSFEVQMTSFPARLISGYRAFQKSRASARFRLRLGRTSKI